MNCDELGEFALATKSFGKNATEKMDEDDWEATVDMLDGDPDEGGLTSENLKGAYAEGGVLEGKKKEHFDIVISMGGGKIIGLDMDVTADDEA